MHLLNWNHLNVFLSADVTETDFIKYIGMYGDNIQGSVSANFSPLHVQSSVVLKGKDSSKLQTSFGSLKKEEVNMQKLLGDCKDRCWVNLSWKKPNLESPIIQSADFGVYQEAFVYNVVFRFSHNLFPVSHNTSFYSWYSLSQDSGYVPLSDPSGKEQAKTGICDCEGAYCDNSALFCHRGGAAWRTVWRRTQPLCAHQPKGALSGSAALLPCHICCYQVVAEEFFLV